MSRSKQELEDRHLRISREKAELASQLNENEEELQVSCVAVVYHASIVVADSCTYDNRLRSTICRDFA